MSGSYEDEIVDISQIDHGELPDDDSNEEPYHGAVTYFRHPFKGNVCIKTFKDAMEVYGLFKAVDSPMADGWYKLAFEMEGAPEAHSTTR